MLELSVQLDAILSGHQNPIYTVENGSKSNQLLTAGNDKGIVLWDLNKMTFDKVLLPVDSSVYALHYIPSLNYLAIGERSGKISIFSFDSQKVIETLAFHNKPVFDLKYLSRKNELIASSEDGTVSVWSLKTFKKIHHLDISNQTVRVIAIDPLEANITFGTKDARIYIFDAHDYSFKYLLK